MANAIRRRRAQSFTNDSLQLTGGRLSNLRTILINLTTRSNLLDRITITNRVRNSVPFASLVNTFAKRYFTNQVNGDSIHVVNGHNRKLTNKLSVP